MTTWGMMIFFLMCVSAVYPIVTVGREDEAELLERMAPYRGVLGILCLFWGILAITTSSQLGVIAYIILIFEILLGAMLGYSWLNNVFSSTDADSKAAVAARTKMDVYAVPMGTLGIALSALWLAYLTNAW